MKVYIDIFFFVNFLMNLQVFQILNYWRRKPAVSARSIAGAGLGALLGVLVVIGYIAVLIIYGMMAGSYYKKKHNEAKLRVKRYYRNLSRLSKMYKKENM